MCPMSSYLENELQKRFNLVRFWNSPEKSVLLETYRDSIRAVVGNASAGADAQLIDELPKLEIVSSFSVGLDKIDLGKCKEKGIRVTNTPDVLTEDVADLAIGLILALLRRLCECDRYVRSGKWKTGDFQLTTKVSSALHILCYITWYIDPRAFRKSASASHSEIVKVSGCIILLLIRMNMMVRSTFFSIQICCMLFSDWHSRQTQ